MGERRATRKFRGRRTQDGAGVSHTRIFGFGNEEELADWMWTPDAFDIISDTWRSVSVWCTWVAENLGDLVIRPERSRRP